MRLTASSCCLRGSIETGRLLDSRGEIGANHGLKITEATENGLIAPVGYTRQSIRVFIQLMTIVSCILTCSSVEPRPTMSMSEGNYSNDSKESTSESKESAKE